MFPDMAYTENRSKLQTSVSSHTSMSYPGIWHSYIHPTIPHQEYYIHELNTEPTISASGIVPNCYQSSMDLQRTMQHPLIARYHPQSRVNHQLMSLHPGITLNHHPSRIWNGGIRMLDLSNDQMGSTSIGRTFTGKP